MCFEFIIDFKYSKINYFFIITFDIFYTTILHMTSHHDITLITYPLLQKLVTEVAVPSENNSSLNVNFGKSQKI